MSWVERFIERREQARRYLASIGMAPKLINADVSRQALNAWSVPLIPGPLDDSDLICVAVARGFDG